MQQSKLKVKEYMASSRQIITAIRLIILTVLFSSVFKIYASENTRNKPNVILILADDMALGDISSFNGGINKTPNLDKLIRESVWFNQAYSGSAVCAPARACLLTGRYPHRTGVVSLNLERYPEFTSLYLDQVTIADVFKTNGYKTALIGKWHLGKEEQYHPMKRGFEEFRGFMGFDIVNYFDFKLDINGTYQTYKKEYLTDVISDHAIDYIKQNKDQPFFLHLAHYAPHRPLGAPEDLIEFYTNKGFDEKTSKVYAMIEVMDRGIGKLINTLEDLGLRENTIIIFASDNGPDPLVGTRFNFDLKGTKYTVNEGGIRVPLLFNWSGHFKEIKVDDLAHFSDIFPTLLNLCHLEFDAPQALDGRSLDHLLKGSNEGDSLVQYFWQWNRGVPYYSHNAAMRRGEWKLVRPFITRGIPEGEADIKPVLYNIKNDPSESINYAAEESGIYNEMKVKLEQWCREVEFDRLRSKD
tara:strand:- start:31820 stop:33226 length:1407 start_codon:yes stop_codon:yes gene_type:complete